MSARRSKLDRDERHRRNRPAREAHKRLGQSTANLPRLLILGGTGVRRRGVEGHPALAPYRYVARLVEAGGRAEVTTAPRPDFGRLDHLRLIRAWQRRGGQVVETYRPDPKRGGAS